VYYGKNYEIYGNYLNNSMSLKSQYLTTILKILLIIILLGVIYLGYLYISDIKEDIYQIKKTAKLKPQCVKELTNSDLTKIVSLVVEKIGKNGGKLDDSQYSKELLKYAIVDDKKMLKKLNIYIKAVDTKKEFPNSNNRVTIKNGSRVFNIPSDDLDIEKDSYTKNIEKELKTRKKEMRIIVVKRGDSLSKIAKRAYGNSKYYYRIIKANPKLQKNPNLIYVGQKLRVP